jgi:hypothetical protein
MKIRFNKNKFYEQGGKSPKFRNAFQIDGKWESVGAIWENENSLTVNLTDDATILEKYAKWLAERPTKTYKKKEEVVPPNGEINTDDLPF